MQSSRTVDHVRKSLSGKGMLEFPLREAGSGIMSYNWFQAFSRFLHLYMLVICIIISSRKSQGAMLCCAACTIMYHAQECRELRRERTLHKLFVTMAFHGCVEQSPGKSVCSCACSMTYVNYYVRKTATVCFFLGNRLFYFQRYTHTLKGLYGMEMQL